MFGRSQASFCMSRIIKVELFTDIVCPWCLIGSARLDKAIAALPGEVTVDVENHPFYLDPNTPPEGYDVGEMLKRKYGREPKEMWIVPGGGHFNMHAYAGREYERRITGFLDWYLRERNIAH